MKKSLTVGIISLFILSALAPMSLGQNVKESKVTLDRHLYPEFYDAYSVEEIYGYGPIDDVEVKPSYRDTESKEIESFKQLTEPVGPMDSAWPMKCHDNRHTSQSPYSTEDNPGIEKWRFVAGGIDGGIAIDNDGVVYFGDKDDYIYAVFQNGIEKWRYKTSGWITSTPAIAEDGTIYVGSWDWILYAINPNGTKKWRIYLAGIISSSPAIGEDGTIYTANSKGRIYAVNPNGTVKWYYSTGGGNIWGDVAIGDDGTIYSGTWFEYFYAINPNGTLKWRSKTGGIIKGPPSIAEDGTIYIGSYDDYLYALYQNGTKKWKIKVGHGTETNPSIASDGTIYVGGGRLYAINPNGTMKWSFYLGSDRHIHKSSPTISADGTIYVGTNIGSVTGGDIIAVNPDGTQRWRKRIANEWVDSSPSIAEDGTIYIGSSFEIGQGFLHAFGNVESNAPPEKPSITSKQTWRMGVKYWLHIASVDPDNNPVSFYIDWGDGTITNWTMDGASGDTCYHQHIWDKWGTYTIKAKAKDTFGLESDLTEFQIKITIPRTRAWFRLVDMFPILQRILNFVNTRL
jgi:outer membrane protein assembly factor BamB